MKVIILSLLVSVSAYAEPTCQRQDIDHYLSKGFTPEQITALCTESGDAKTPPTRAAAGKISKQISASNDPGLFLLSAINAEKPQILNGKLQYTQKTCFEYGISGPFGRRDRICPKINFSIALAELKVVDYSKRIGLFGKNQITVQGNIDPHIPELEEFNKSEKKALKKHIIETNRAEIPIQSNANIDQVLSALEELAGI